MYDKRVSIQSSKVLNYFHSLNKAVIETGELESALPESSRSAIRHLLSSMVKRGLLLRIKRGLYYIIPYESESQSYLPDWHLLAEPLTRGREHYIGYYSALQIHDLITQPSLTEQIVVSKQMKPSKVAIRETPFQFIYLNPKRFFGGKEIWINSFDKVKCSDLEKTIIECLYKPEYAGGITEIAKAIYTARNKLDFLKLLTYSERFKSQAVIKRLGYLLELMQIPTDATEILHARRTASYVKLDTEVPATGKFISKWRIQQNVDSQTILNARFT